MFSQILLHFVIFFLWCKEVRRVKAPCPKLGVPLYGTKNCPDIFDFVLTWSQPIVHYAGL